MLNLTVHDLLDKLEDHIADDSFLLEYAGDDFDALRELVDEFIGNECYEVSEDGITNAIRIPGRIINILNWELDKANLEEYTRLALMGYAYLISSHIRFRENEKVGN